MTQSADKTKALEEIAALIVDFLPGPAPGYPVVPHSFQGIARELDLGSFWQGHSKPQSVEALLEGALESSPEKFSELLLRIIDACRHHHKSDKNSLTVQDIDEIRICLKKLDLHISQMESEDFVAGLPFRMHTQRATKALQRNVVDLNSRMRKELIALTMMPESEQAYALELFLNKLFINGGLSPHSPFRQKDAQIAGEFHSGKQIVQLNAFWQPAITESQISEILHQVSEQAKCMLFSLRGFSDDIKHFISEAREPSLFATDVRDIFLVLDGGANLEQMIGLKLKSAEKGNPFASVEQLLWS